MKALALVEAPDHVCGRYRISAFAPALDAFGWSITVQGLASGTFGRLAQLRSASRYDVVILQRKLLPLLHLMLLRRYAKRLIFDFDDAVLYRDSYDSRGPHSRRRGSRFGTTVRAADLIIAGNGFLADCATIHGASRDRVCVIPTCIDTSRYVPRSHESKPTSIVRLVWIGSSSTLQGIERQRPLLERLGREFPDLRLRLISDRFPRFDPLPVEAIAWTQAGESSAIAGGDIGISWVPDDLWSRGKCGLKVLQYGAAGLPTVANPVGVHPEILHHSETGELATTEDEWIDAIRLLVNEPERRFRKGRAARERVESSYSVASWSGAFVGAITGSSLVPASHTRSPYWTKSGKAVRR